MQRWYRELNLLLLLTLPALVLGMFTGYIALCLLVVVTLLLIRQTIYIDHLEKWLSRGAFGDKHPQHGIWRDIYYHIWKIRKIDKKRKKKLTRMIDRFRTSTDALPDAAVVLGSYGEIDWTNKSARDILGLKKSDKGQRIANLVRNPLFIQYLKSNDYQQKISIPSPVNENIILQISIVPYGTGLRLLLAQDITQLKNIERMRTDFVANVSHELRTPLTVLKGYLETLLELENVPSVYLRSFQNMSTQTERMQLLIDDLLLLARLETKSKKSECINISELLKQLCKESDLLEKDECRVNLKLDSPTNLLGDPEELRSAFSNLLANALKYSPADKPVYVKWFKNSENGVCLEIEDFGEGISSNDIPRITERFYRVEVKRNRKINGTGLGLAIVKHVLVRHDARLEIDSQLGKGSRFRCQFPQKRIC
ncbi:phosphate regulon sensor histidine kinase PhoR [Methylomonas paludis]|uniref:histidine kinase n=1 Tax=Methylomonas paludis TaxID=1173101 RepID=A0A975MP03_9GAMM|nr:phosphate regulon sensor histidine kinase PhoR [Methylomonas paludis]QWF71290.1 phosphate regulon sensor histidine kinase PhoR [Methylomonas paludis]